MDITDATKARVGEEEYKRMFRDQLTSRFNSFYDEKFYKEGKKLKRLNIVFTIIGSMALSFAILLIVRAISDYDSNPGWLKVDTGTHCVEYVMKGSNPNLKNCKFDTVDGEHCVVWVRSDRVLRLDCGEKQTPPPDVLWTGE